MRLRLRLRAGERLRVDERGMALVMALGVMLVLSLVLAMVVQYTVSNSGTASRSVADQKAFALAEAGMNNAVGVISQCGSTCSTSTQVKPPPAAAGDPNSTVDDTLGGGTVTWGGTYNSATKTWTITSIGSVGNPTGPSAAPVTRRLTGAVQVVPPQYNFVALNQTCEKHTLMVRSSGQLTVTNAVHINSCHNDLPDDPDAFDVFGEGGNISAPDIRVVGGWEIDGGNDVTGAHATVRVNGTLCSLLHSNASPAPPGCPLVEQPVVPDPFASTPTPTLGPPAWGTTTPADVSKKSRNGNVATLTLTAPLAGLVVGGSITVSGVDSSFDGVFTVTAIGGGGTTISYNNSGPNTPTITSKQLTSGVATLTTSAPHTLTAGNSVTVSGIDSVFNGTYTVTGVPSPTTFSYAKARSPFTRSVDRKGLVSGVVTLRTTAAHGLVVGDIFSLAGVDALLNGGPFTVTSVPSTTTLTYAYSGPATMNLTVTNKAMTNGTATLTTSVAPNPGLVGDTVTVSIGDPRFDGTYTVTAVNVGARTLSYVPSPVVQTVTNAALTGGIATLTMSVAPNFAVGDSVTVNIGNYKFDGTYTVTAVNAGAKTFSYSVVRTVTNKALSNGVATLTTSVAPNVAVGDTVTVNIADTRFDGTHTVTAVNAGARTFSYSVVKTVTNGAVTTGVATLTTSAAHNFAVGNSVIVSTGDSRYDGTFTISAVPSTTTFSYTPATIATTSWAVASNLATLTVTTPPHGVKVGNSITVSGFTGAGPTYLNGNFTVTAVTASTITYAITHANASGTQNATVALGTVASAALSGTARVANVGSSAASGTATVANVASGAASGTTTIVSVASGAASGTATVPAYIAANTTVSPVGTLSATGNVAATATSGSFTPAATPSTGAVALNNPGSAAIPTPYTVSGTATLSPGTYYGGICIGAPSGSDCVSDECGAGAYIFREYSPSQDLDSDITASQTTLDSDSSSSAGAVAVGDVIEIDSEWMLVSNVVAQGGGIYRLTVTRGYLGTTAAPHDNNNNNPILEGTANPTANVTLLPGTYIMAGGGFHVCGVSTLSAPNVLIYNTNDPTHPTGYGAVGQIILNTTGSVTLGPQTSGLYDGLLIFQDPARVVSSVSCFDKTWTTNDMDPFEQDDIDTWDIALLSMASTGPDGALGSISGTVYAPANRAIFADLVSGRANLAVLTSCILIEGGNSTFDFQPEGLFAVGFRVLGQWG